MKFCLLGCISYLMVDKPMICPQGCNLLFKLKLKGLIYDLVEHNCFEVEIKFINKGDVGNAIVNTQRSTAFEYFDSFKSTNRCILAVIALSDCQEVMAARKHLLVHWMQRKQQKQFGTLHLQWHSHCPLTKSLLHIFLKPTTKEWTPSMPKLADKAKYFVWFLNKIGCS